MSTEPKKKCIRKGCTADAWVIYLNKPVVRDYCKKCYNMLSKRLPPKKPQKKNPKNAESLASMVASLRQTTGIARPTTPPHKQMPAQQNTPVVTPHIQSISEILQNIH